MDNRNQDKSPSLAQTANTVYTGAVLTFLAFLAVVFGAATYLNITGNWEYISYLIVGVVLTIPFLAFLPSTSLGVLAISIIVAMFPWLEDSFGKRLRLLSSGYLKLVLWFTLGVVVALLTMRIFPFGHSVEGAFGVLGVSLLFGLFALAKKEAPTFFVWYTRTIFALALAASAWSVVGPLMPYNIAEVWQVKKQYLLAKQVQEHLRQHQERTDTALLANVLDAVKRTNESPESLAKSGAISQEEYRAYLRALRDNPVDRVMGGDAVTSDSKVIWLVVTAVVAIAIIAVGILGKGKSGAKIGGEVSKKNWKQLLVLVVGGILVFGLGYLFNDGGNGVKPEGELNKGKPFARSEKELKVIREGKTVLPISFAVKNWTHLYEVSVHNSSVCSISYTGTALLPVFENGSLKGIFSIRGPNGLMNNGKIARVPGPNCKDFPSCEAPMGLLLVEINGSKPMVLENARVRDGDIVGF